MGRMKNLHGTTLADCSVPLTTKSSLFIKMSALPAKELALRITNIKDPDTRVLALAHANALTNGARPVNAQRL